MFLQRKFHEDLVEVLDAQQLFNPCQKQFIGRSHCGEELQDPQLYDKQEMIFPSGEALPRCWLQPDYHLRPCA